MATTKALELAQLSTNLQVDENGNVTNIDIDTSQVSEANTALFYTDERVDDRVSNLLVAGDNITLVYDDANNTLTISGVEDDFTNNTTDDLEEGNTNLYYTDARAISAIKGDDDWNATNWDTAYGWGNHAGAGYATTTYVDSAVSNLIDTAPDTLNTLNELAAALGDDPNFATTVSNNIGTKIGYTTSPSTPGNSSYLLSIGRDSITDHQYIQSHGLQPLKLNPVGNRVDVGDRLNVADNITTGGIILINNLGSDRKIQFGRSGAKTISIEQDTSQIYFYNVTDEQEMLTIGNNRNISAYGDLFIGTSDNDHGHTYGDDGVRLTPDGFGMFTRNSSYATLYVNKLNNHGSWMDFHKNGSKMGVIGVSGNSEDIYFTAPQARSGAGSGIYLNGNGILPATGTGSTNHNAIDLGQASVRWRNLWLSNDANIEGELNVTGNFDFGSSIGGHMPGHYFHNTYSNGNIYIHLYPQADFSGDTYFRFKQPNDGFTALWHDYSTNYLKYDHIFAAAHVRSVGTLNVLDASEGGFDGTDGIAIGGANPAISFASSASGRNQYLLYSSIGSSSIPNALRLYEADTNKDVLTVAGSNNDNRVTMNLGGSTSTYATSSRTTMVLEGSDTSLIEFRNNNTHRGYIYSTGSTIQYWSFGDIEIVGDDDIDNKVTFNDNGLHSKKLIASDIGLRVNTTYQGNFGDASFSWNGNGIYPTLYSSHPDRWVMMCFPHIPFLQNGARGHTGSSNGSKIRFEGGLSGQQQYDIGVFHGHEGKFSIGIANGTPAISVHSDSNVHIQDRKVARQLRTFEKYFTSPPEGTDYHIITYSRNWWGVGNTRIKIYETYYGPSSFYREYTIDGHTRVLHGAGPSSVSANLRVDQGGNCTVTVTNWDSTNETFDINISMPGYRRALVVIETTGNLVYNSTSETGVSGPTNAIWINDFTEVV